MPSRFAPGFRRALGPAVLALCAHAACTTNHDDFKKTADPGGSAGKAGAAGASGGTGAQGGGGSGGADAGIDSGPPEPAGPSVLTFVHGVVDAPSLVVCFGKLADGGTVAPFGSALGGAPLGYGSSYALKSLSGADFATDSVVPLLIAGELSQVAGLDCAQAVALAQQTEAAFNAQSAAADAGIGAAGASGEDAGATDASASGGAGGLDAGATSSLRVRSLPAIPAGTLSGQRSYLLVASGCLGGLGYDAGSAEQLCGSGYTPTSPTLFPVLVTISRLMQDGRVGMQVVHASRATSTVSLQIMRAPPVNSSFALVSGLREGEVAPKPPNFEHSAGDYAPSSEIQLAGGAISEPISDALSGSSTQIVDGASYAIILLGPRLDFGAPPPLWNAARASIVATAPLP